MRYTRQLMYNICIESFAPTGWCDRPGITLNFHRISVFLQVFLNVKFNVSLNLSIRNYAANVLCLLLYGCTVVIIIYCFANFTNHDSNVSVGYIYIYITLKNK